MQAAGSRVVLALAAACALVSAGCAGTSTSSAGTPSTQGSSQASSQVSGPPATSPDPTSAISGDASAAPTAVASTSNGTSAASTSSAPVSLERYYSQTLTWRSCQNSMKCAVLKVPVSYAQPGKYGDTSINIAKLPAWGKRRGALVLNPGGPGGSGIDYASAGQGVVSSAVLEHFDLVGFDPRGVASSHPIKCLTDAQLDAMIAFDASPDTPAEVSRGMQLADILGRGCAKNAPVLSRFVDTVSVAQDMDVLRAALAEKKLNYLGKSYGTFIGSTYAHLFPSKVGAFVLDGVVDPKLDNTGLSKMQAMGFERAFARFLSHCIKNDCPLGATVAQARAKIASIIAAADSKPLPTSQKGRPLTQSLLVSGLLFGMYDSTYGWQEEMQALRGVVAGNGDDMLSMVDWFLSRENGHYQDNSNEVIYAVNCIDRQDRPDAAKISALAKQWSAQYPLFGSYLAWSMAGCAKWPVPATGVAGAWTGGPVPPVLIVGNTWDPATPVEGAKSLAAQMPRSVFLQWNGDGHTAYMQGSSCVDGLVNAFYLRGALPKTGTVCN